MAIPLLRHLKTEGNIFVRVGAGDARIGHRLQLEEQLGGVGLALALGEEVRELLRERGDFRVLCPCRARHRLPLRKPLDRVVAADEGDDTEMSEEGGPGEPKRRRKRRKDLAEQAGGDLGQLMRSGR